MTSTRPNKPIAIVTGASRRTGIGAATCRALATDGVDILFTHWSPYDRTMPWGADEEGPSRLQQELESIGVRCESMQADLSAIDTPKRILDETIALLGPPLHPHQQRHPF